MTLRVDSLSEKVMNIDKCKCNQTYEKELKKTEYKFNKRLKAFLKTSWDVRSKITVEPFVVCYLLPSLLASLAVQNLCLEKACLVNLGYDQETCTNIMQGRTHNYTEQERNLHVIVSKMTAWSFPVQTAVPGVLTLFVGAWSDRSGNRKLFMVLPILGKLISVIGIILCTIFFFQIGTNETALIEGLTPALAGGRTAMTMAVYSYITDITSESERMFRLGIVTAIITLSRPIGLALSGIMTNRIGYYGVFMIASAFYLTGLVYITLRIKDNKNKKKTVEENEKKNVESVSEKEEKTSLWMVLVRDLLATVNVAFRSRPGSRRLQIILIVCAYIVIVGPVMGEGQMTYWFTRYKFKFTEVDYSLFLTYSVLIGTVGSIITIYLFTKRWMIEDSVIGLIACVSKISASILYALAPNRTIFFIGPVLDMFSSAGATCLRSLASKLVNSDEIGKTSSLMSISEALIPVVYAPIYSKVYLSTLSTSPGAFYFISATLAVPGIIILITIYTIRCKEKQLEALTPAAETEKKVIHDEVTKI